MYKDIKEMPSLEVLNDLLELREDFTLWWKVRPEKYFNKPNSAKTWNTRFSKTRAFTTIHSAGYRQAKILGKLYLEHRIIWKMIHGYDPDYIDHIDGNPANNCISNLREADAVENSRNKKLYSCNSSGHIGVFKNRGRTKPWRSTITHNGFQIILGTFDTVEEALEVRKQAEIKYGYHENHGRNQLT